MWVAFQVTSKLKIRQKNHTDTYMLPFIVGLGSKFLINQFLEMEEIDFRKLYYRFGQKVKARRKQLMLSQSALGGRANLEKAAIQRIERGHNITLKTLYKISTALEVRPSDLLNF